MYEMVQKTRGLLRAGAAVLAALLLCTGMPARASSVTHPPEQTARMLVPVGHTVGIKLFARGVVVVRPPDGGTPARACGLQTGDVIVRCGGTAITSTEQFRSLLQSRGAAETDLQVRRDGKTLTVSVSPERNAQGAYSIGAWIRDSMAGIGTVTFYDPATRTFGALGHGITDTDTALLLPFASGSVLPSRVKAVRKGQTGEAGELRGEFDLTAELGKLRANTDSGIFGTMEHCPSAEKPIPAAKLSELRPGPAVIRANIRGDEVREYAVEIVRVIGDAPDGRDLVLKVTDPALIAATGGIVQGMSGSPILQDGKLAGAVTHVFLNDPKKGYGISIETMLSAAE